MNLQLPGPPTTGVAAGELFPSHLELIAYTCARNTPKQSQDPTCAGLTVTHRELAASGLGLGHLPMQSRSKSLCNNQKTREYKVEPASPLLQPSVLRQSILFYS